MYISRLSVDGFRGLDDFSAKFEPGLNVITGANNAGKTSLINAFRLVLAPVNRSTNLYFDPDDFSKGNVEATIQVEVNALSDHDRAMHLEALDLTGDKVTFGKKFERTPDTDFRGYRASNLVGQNGRINERYPGRDSFECVYIEPLRDARRELASYSGNRLRRLVSFLSSSDQIDELTELLKDHDIAVSDNSAIQNVQRIISDQFRNLTSFGSLANPKISPSAQNLSVALRRLKLGLSDNDSNWEIDQIGLGYANLLFLATILSELHTDDMGKHRVILIEEPEAHLHPQLQSALVSVLSESLHKNSNLQVILTTHSATIVGKSGISGLQKMARHEGRVHHWRLDAPKKDKEKLNRFFVSRRPEVLFAEFVLLVEGVAEELILPVIFEARAKQRFPDADRENLTQRDFRRFLSEKLQICAVHSVDFKPYVHLLTTQGSNSPSSARVYVLTDSDEERDQPTGNHSSPGESRRVELIKVVEDSGFPLGRFQVCITPVTFEKELVFWAGRTGCEPLQKLLLESLQELYPRAWPNYINLRKTDLTAEDVWNFIADRDSFRKGEFAQTFSTRILDSDIALCSLPSGLDSVFEDLVSIFEQQNGLENSDQN